MFNILILFLARLLSLVFHPLILFLPIPYIIILHATSSITEAIRWTFISWLFIFIFGVIMLYQVKRGTFTNLDVSRREQRPLFFFYFAIIAIIYILSLWIFHGPIVMILLTVGVLCGLVLLDVINNKVKASIHVACVTSILFSFVILNGIAYSWVLVIIPFVAWSRIKLHRHTVSEVITGAVFGAFLTVLVYAIIEVGLL